MHTNNILLAAACVLSGNSFEKLKQLFKFLGLVTITNRTFLQVNFNERANLHVYTCIYRM